VGPCKVARFLPFLIIVSDSYPKSDSCPRCGAELPPKPPRICTGCALQQALVSPTDTEDVDALRLEDVPASESALHQAADGKTLEKPAQSTNLAFGTSLRGLTHPEDASDHL
jgi:hypothetical protein